MDSPSSSAYDYYSQYSNDSTYSRHPMNNNNNNTNSNTISNNIARSSAGPAPALLDDWKLPLTSAATPTQSQFVRCASSRYPETGSSERTIHPSTTSTYVINNSNNFICTTTVSDTNTTTTTIKLPYPTNNINNYLIKTEHNNIIHNTTNANNNNNINQYQNEGSTLSLASNESRKSLNEEKQVQEIRRLRHELEVAQQKVVSLSSRLSTNAHMASAFELSLTNMTDRLLVLTETAEKKDNELVELRSLIESLKKANILLDLDKRRTGSLDRNYNTSLVAVAGQDIDKKLNEMSVDRSGDLDNVAQVDKYGSNAACNATNTTPSHKLSDIVPCNSAVELCSIHSNSNEALLKKHNIRGWLRNSFGKAFKKKIITNKHNHHHQHLAIDSSMSDTESDYAIASNGITMASVCNPINYRHLDSSVASIQNSTQINELNRSTNNTIGAGGVIPIKGDTFTNISTSTQLSDPASSPALPIPFNLTQLSTICAGLRQQLDERDIKLTDAQLDALSSAHQLEQMRELITAMKLEMASLKADNDRLQRLVHVSCGNDDDNNMIIMSQHQESSASCGNSGSGDNEEAENVGLCSNNTASSHVNEADMDSENSNMKSNQIYKRNRRNLPIQFNHLNLSEYDHQMSIPIRLQIESTNDTNNRNGNRNMIGYCHLPKHDPNVGQLEKEIRLVFHEYLDFIDPNSSLTIDRYSTQLMAKYTYNTLSDRTISLAITDHEESPASDDLGEVVPIDLDNKESDTSPIISLTLIGSTSGSAVESLALHTLISNNILQRYLALIKQYRLIIFSGPSGTGKTFLANQIAQHLVAESGNQINSNTMVNLTIDQRSTKELKSYLASLLTSAASVASSSTTATTAALAGSAATTTLSQTPSSSSSAAAATSPSQSPPPPPIVVVLDNLHHITSLSDIFDNFLVSSSQLNHCPYIIGTMTQASYSNSNLQSHHNFRWILFANHLEPVSGLLGRYLRRKLIHTVMTNADQSLSDLLPLVSWVPLAWHHLNRCLEIHSCSDVTVGPRLFLSCPLASVDAAQLWFQDLWNYSLAPYFLEAVREGIQIFGKRGSWEDPLSWIIQSWPWKPQTKDCNTHRNCDPSTSLIRLRPEDVGYDHVSMTMSNSYYNTTSTASSFTGNNSKTSPLLPLPMATVSLATSSGIPISNSINKPTMSNTYNNDLYSPPGNNTFPRTDPLLHMLMRLQNQRNDTAARSRSGSISSTSQGSTGLGGSLNRNFEGIKSSPKIQRLFETDAL